MTGSDYLTKYAYYYPLATGLSQAQVIDLLNTARTEMYILLREYPVTNTFVTTVGQSDYTIPANLGLMNVWFVWGNYGMMPRSPNLERIKLDDYPLLDCPIGFPECYAPISSTSIRLYPTPGITSITMYTRYLQPLQIIYTASNLATADPDISDKYGNLVVIKLASLVAMQDQNYNTQQYLEHLLLQKASRTTFYGG